MNDDVNEIVYNLLQNEYLKRKNISLDEVNLKKIIKVFPQDWFILYSLEQRINVISIALKNNTNIEHVLDLMKK